MAGGEKANERWSKSEWPAVKKERTVVKKTNNRRQECHRKKQKNEGKWEIE